MRPPGGRAFGNVRHTTLSHSQPCIEAQTPNLRAAPSVWDTQALAAGGTCDTPFRTDLLQRGDESLPSLEGAEQAREVLHVPQDDAQCLHAASVGRGLGLQRTQQIADPRDELAVQSVQLCLEVCGWAGGEGMISGSSLAGYPLRGLSRSCNHQHSALGTYAAVGRLIVQLCSMQWRIPSL